MAVTGFDQWMERVNGAMETAVGLGSDDLADWSYRDAYDDGISPAEAAHEALLESGWDTETETMIR